MKRKSLEERIAKALAARKEGKNCAQCVLLAFEDCMDTEADVLLRIACGLGGGIGGSGEVCGALSALAVAEGLVNPAGAVKTVVYPAVRGMADAFRKNNGGRVCCRDLKAAGALRSCEELIIDAITIFHNRLSCAED